MRATGDEPQKHAATKRDQREQLNNCFSHALKLEGREKSRLDADQGFRRFFVEGKSALDFNSADAKNPAYSVLALAFLGCGRSTNSDERCRPLRYPRSRAGIFAGPIND